ncbi:hypothetical protein [Saccharothrix texasensis]|uniref:Uncharacterized protein n=1 Tax=Saccharothrix texasensis TaxID=103734 RepID=A0A3N1HA73_9PSEU|nr:hypothetical protein [Saccharothrix texasensis]ROP39423.1 hypothetical protein EDD40_4810 [Saccharothrix texasensis]
MTQQDDFLGGLHYDRPPAAEAGPAPGVVRYHPVGRPAGRARPRVSAWWHVAGFLLGVVAAGLGAVAWGYALDQFDEVRLRGLVALGLAGLLVGLVSLGKLSPAAPLAAGLAAVVGSVVYEVGTLPFLPVLRPVFESGGPVLVGVLLVVSAWRRR